MPVFDFHYLCIHTVDITQCCAVQNTAVTVTIDLSIFHQQEAVTETQCQIQIVDHYHGDHIGNMDRILSDIPIYMGKISREISLVLNRHLQKAYHYNTNCFNDKSSFLHALERANTFESGQKISIKDMDITPYRVDHSAFDSYFFLIESGGVRVLHTGDFRDHGFSGDELPHVLEQIGQVDCLICEGTMLSRGKEEVLTEKELSKRAGDIMAQHKNVFILCSSTNIDRIRAIYEAKPIIPVNNLFTFVL